MFKKLLFKSSKGARAYARKIVIVFSENELDADHKFYWNNLSDQLGIKLLFIDIQKHIGTQSFMDMEDPNNPKEIGKLLGTGTVP